MVILLTINQGAADNEAFALKSSDISHGVTNVTETDTYLTISKMNANDGGANILGMADSGATALRCTGIAVSDDTTKSTSGSAPFTITAAKKNSADSAAMGTDANLAVITNDGTARFIFDAEGSFHADVESTTFDHYNDASLVRAFDLSHNKGVIASKFDDFIEYNHETLADLKLVGREENGTPNKFVNVTKMQQLHNGAIWQQYTEMQKMKELMYDTMVELIGKEKADAKLKDHDIKLLDENTLLN